MDYVCLMTKKYVKFLYLLPAFVIASCGPAQNDPGPGGVTVGEAKLLDEAAEMLDERNAPPEPVKAQKPEMAEEQPQ